MIASMLFQMLVLGLFAATVFWGMERKTAGGKSDFLFRLNGLRGIFAIEIVIGHVVRYEKTILYPFGKMMIISVAFFFFISAFGMAVSFQEKENYLKGFLLQKLSYLLVLALIAFGHNVLIDWICPKDLSLCFRGGNLVFWFASRTNWYLRELALFYILFYFVYKYMKKGRVLIITGITLIFASIVFKCGWITGWYASAMAFPLGLAFGEYFASICSFLHSVWGKMTTMILTLTGVIILWFSENSLIGMVYMKNLMCIAGILILLYFINYFSIGNSVNRFLNKYATEIYLFQFAYYYMAGAYGWSYWISLLFVIPVTVFVAVLMHPVIRFAKENLEKLYTQLFTKNTYNKIK